MYSEHTLMHTGLREKHQRGQVHCQLSPSNKRPQLSSPEGEVTESSKQPQSEYKLPAPQALQHCESRQTPKFGVSLALRPPYRFHARNVPQSTSEPRGRHNSLSETEHRKSTQDFNEWELDISGGTRSRSFPKQQGIGKVSPPGTGRAPLMHYPMAPPWYCHGISERKASEITSQTVRVHSPFKLETI